MLYFSAALGSLPPDFLRFHHIGIVVANVQQAAELLADMLGNGERPESVQQLPYQGVNVCFLRLSNSPLLELVEPLDKESPIYLLASQGGGLHHLCYETRDIDACISALTPFARIIRKPVDGFDGRQTAFLFVKKKLAGIRLLEIAQI